MKNFCKKLRAFTLAEMAVVFMILGLIATATFKITKSNSTYYLNKFMYYAAFNNLQKGVEELVAVGCSTADLNATPSPYCTTPYSLPVIGHNGTSRGLCDRLAEEEFNTIGSVACNQAASLDDNTDFKTTTPNFTTTNGMRFFNFGSTPAGTSDPLVKLFTVYIDIDGPKRNSVLNEDVMKFNVYTNGVVLPDYDSIGANDPNYLSASVKYWETATNKYEELLTSVSYREAYCKAKLVPSISTTYCTAPSSYPTYTADPKCPNNNYECKVTINQPGFAFGN